MASIYLNSVERVFSMCVVTAGLSPVVCRSTESGVSRMTLEIGQEVLCRSVERSTSSVILLGGASNFTSREILADIMRLWGCSCETDDPCLQTDALSVLNGAMQFIHANGKELPYLTRRTRIYYAQRDAGPNMKAIELESDVQNVDGYVRAVTPYWISEILHKGTRAANGMPRGTPFAVGAKVELGWSALDPPNDFFIYGTHYTDVETLRAALQARTLNGATCYIEDSSAEFTIAWDYPPEMLVALPVAGTKIAVPASGAIFRVTGADTTVWTSAVPTYDGTVQTEAPLTPASDRWQFDNWTALYGSDAGLCYYLERTHSGLADSSRVRLLLTGNGLEESGMYSVDVAIEPARLSWSDYRLGTAVPIPHRYVESLLLPIARYRATSSHRYRQRERHDNLMAQYKEALTMLGIVDPQTAIAANKKEAAAP